MTKLDEHHTKTIIRMKKDPKNNWKTISKAVDRNREMFKKFFQNYKRLKTATKTQNLQKEEYQRCYWIKD